MDVIKVNLQTVIIVVLSVVAFYLWHSKSEDKKFSEMNLKAASDTISTFKDKYNREVSEKRSYVLANKSLLTENDSLKETLKNIKPEVVVKWKTKIEYRDTLKIPYPVDVEIPCEFNIPWNYKDKWFEIGGISSDKGISITDRKFFLDQSLVVGWKRDKWYQSTYASVRIVNSNPDAQIIGLDSYIIKPKKGIFSKWYFWAVAGGVGGILITK